VWGELESKVGVKPCNLIIVKVQVR
jgi:hypothetical protein